MQRLVCVLGVTLFLAACAAKKEEPPFTNSELIQKLKEQNFDAQETARGVMVVFPATVFFAYDSADLSPEARQRLDVLATIVNHPRALSRRISVEGHADAIGSQGYNLPLSQRRAETVAQELIANQTRRERVRSQGFGELYPIAPNTNPDGSDNPAGRAKNRRVEVFLEN
jgi:photosystem I P700 chlorophyll a apoprotein A2